MGEDTTTADSNTGNKRKLDGLELAKLKAQEIAARISSEAESKRPRVESHSSQPVLYPASHSRSPVSDSTHQFQPTTNPQVASYPYSAPSNQYYGSQVTTKKMSIPNNKVGVIIGKGGETIKYLIQQSGAKIQITRDTEADPYSTTRDVDLSGTTEQINRAEQLVNDVIAEADSGGSAPSSNRVLSLQPGAEQIEIKVPNMKVSLLIGKGGETIKTIQSQSGARMQIIPLRLPPGDTSTERSVFISGLPDQIEAAKELVNEIVTENRLRNPPMPTSYAQPVYNPTPDASLQQQQAAGYGYVGGSYPTQASYYSNYPAQQTGYDQSNPSAVAPQQNSNGYSYTTQQDQSGQVQSDPSYGYNQSSQGYNQGYSNQASNYGQQTNPAQAATDQQNPYGTSGYSVTTPASYPVPPVYPSYAYNQRIPQGGYAAPQGYYSQPPAAYGQTGYPSNYTQAVNPPVYGQPQSEPTTQTQGGESNGNTGSGYSSPPAAAAQAAQE